MRCLLSGQGGHPPLPPTPTLCQLALCRYQLPPAVSKVRFQDLSAIDFRISQSILLPLKAPWEQIGFQGSCGMKKCENVLVAAVCGLVGSLEPCFSATPSPSPTSFFSGAWLWGRRLLPYRIIVKMRAKKGFCFSSTDGQGACVS